MNNREQVAELVKHLMFLFGVESVPKDKFNQAADCLESLVKKRDELLNQIETAGLGLGAACIAGTGATSGLTGRK